MIASTKLPLMEYKNDKYRILVLYIEIAHLILYLCNIYLHVLARLTQGTHKISRYRYGNLILDQGAK